ncbi:MAG: DUF6152 family protein [Steroidobacteraceae bacterium]
MIFLCVRLLLLLGLEMENFIRRVCLLGGVLLMGAAPALAHHSYSMFDGKKEVELVGIVKEWAFVNPHAYLTLIVSDSAGSSTEWLVEANGPAAMTRYGITADTFKPGEKATVLVHPRRNGLAGGSFISVKLADGTVLKHDPLRGL